ncbi:MAG TPA: zf-HC2 domain-containing protein [Aggregatilineales bacterium]|jgi:anti-sigma factor RsiW|nr:hypothetical protein [Chloroflexota bacterium]HOA22396.1 zf-HC2 domain-containing protein [Aggregatilineales bacterium]HPV08154.1 zf-HC2 domain-containing protein [Aggregatilineales bacterium]HQA68280.1 zf-HC2 domain-containing protein [Aggregatilineales bacterium]HQE17391.1 zf-HC2 domain-containing protein [Aggregatilineales bacterium]
MAHNPYEMMISLSLDGLLSQEEEAELEKHLQVCPDCLDLRDRMCLVDTLFSKPALVAPSINFTASVMQRVEAYETRRRWQPWIIGVLVVASLIAALNIAAPVIFFSLGLNEAVLEWPIVQRALVAFMDGFATVQTGAQIAYEWLIFVVTEPTTLGVIVTALVLASTWIGMLEVSKAQRLAGARQEA